VQLLLEKESDTGRRNCILFQLYRCGRSQSYPHKL